MMINGRRFISFLSGSLEVLVHHEVGRLIELTTRSIRFCIAIFAFASWRLFGLPRINKSRSLGAKPGVPRYLAAQEPKIITLSTPSTFVSSSVTTCFGPNDLSNNSANNSVSRELFAETSRTFPTLREITTSAFSLREISLRCGQWNANSPWDISQTEFFWTRPKN